MAPSVEGVPRPVSFPLRGISVSSQFQADEKPDLQRATFKVCKYIQFCVSTVIIPADPRPGDLKISPGQQLQNLRLPWETHANYSKAEGNAKVASPGLLYLRTPL